MRDFFDIFNHRIISLFYQALEKYRFTIPYERGERDRFSHHVLALIGLGTPGLQDRQRGRPTIRCSFIADCFRCIRAPPSALRQVLADYFEVPVEIEQFVGAWYPVEVESQCSLGEASHVFRAVGLRRRGGRRDLGPAIARAHPSGSADARSNTSIFCRAAKRYRQVRVAHVLLCRRASSIWKCS